MNKKINLWVYFFLRINYEGSFHLGYIRTGNNRRQDSPEQSGVFFDLWSQYQKRSRGDVTLSGSFTVASARHDVQLSSVRGIQLSLNQ